MTITQQTLLAIVRAGRPRFRSKYDRVAFAVHAYMLADDYKLIAVGAAAENAQELRNEAEEVGLEGWTELEGCYAFQYADMTGKRLPVLLKAVVLEQKLLIYWLSPSSNKAPVSLPLDSDKYTTGSSDLAGGYQNLDDLAKRLHTSFHGQETSPGAQPASTPSTEAASSLREPGQAQNLLAEPGYGSRPIRPSIGGDDVVPPGFRAPGMSSSLPDIPGMRGGMHVGPDDPLFAGRMRHQPRPGGILPAGARWDPVRPPGMEGFNPEDFQRSGRQGGVHPDMAQPGPGSTDWDSMYG